LRSIPGAKMKLTVPYGGGSVAVRLPDDVRVLHGTESESVDERKTLKRALSSPMDAPGLSRFLAGADDVVVIVNDAKRPTPTAMILEQIGAELSAVPDITYLVATGTHRRPTPGELEHILGPAARSTGASRLVVHDARDASAMRRLGRTPLGTDVEISRLVTDASRIVVIGSVEPHYFAGFTGGRKAFLPGTASYETVRQNHSHAMHPASQLMALGGNPVHDDMMEALALMGDRKVFAAMTVLDASHRVCGAFAGDIRSTFDAAVVRARDVYCVGIDRKADVVVAVATRPSDSDLYQAHKAIESGKLALAAGGILILVAACSEGLGNDAFVRQLSASARPEDVARDIGTEYSLGDHKAVKLAELVMRAEVWTVTDLPDDTIRNIFFRPFHDLQTALDEARAVKGKAAGVLVLMDAAVTVPRIV
jgi:nickel-dependent lactate racemase